MCIPVVVFAFGAASVCCGRIAADPPAVALGDDAAEAGDDTGREADAAEAGREAEAAEAAREADAVESIDEGPAEVVADGGPIVDSSTAEVGEDARPSSVFASDRVGLRALSIVGEHVYWGCHPSSSGTKGAILRRRRDATGSAEVVYESASLYPQRIVGLPDGLAILDVTGSVLTLRSGVVRVVASSLRIATDLEGSAGDLYWVHWPTPDGSGAVGTVAAMAPAEPRTILKDLSSAYRLVITDDQFLWVGTGSGLLRTDLTKTPYTPVLVGPSSLGGPFLRRYGDYVYWSGRDTLHRVAKGATEMQTIHTLPVGYHVFGLAVDADGVFYVEQKDDASIMRLTTTGAVRLGAVTGDVSDITSAGEYVYVGVLEGQIHRFAK